jgi:hypothetical protein
MHHANGFPVRPSVPKTKIVTAFGKRSAEAGSPAPVHESDATFEFAAETGVAVKEPATRANVDRRTQVIALAGVVVIAAITAGVYWKDRWLPTASAAGEGSLRIESDPAGAEVRVNGAARGTTPLSLTIPAGQYRISVHQGANVKELPVSVTSGAVTVHHITWAETPAVAVATGHLSVATDPPGSTVSIDGEERGISPVTIRDLAIGQHRVVVRARGSSVTRTVLIEAGATASMFIGGSQAAVPGSMTIASPIPIQVFEDGRLIGTSEMDRVILPGGDHSLELVADSVGFRGTRTVRVTPGQTAAVSVDLPRAPVSINAVPWAEVFIDGTRVGETPLGNLPQTLGPHEIVFRHPQLGERRVNTLVTLKETNRITMDMRQR